VGIWSSTPDVFDVLFSNEDFLLFFDAGPLERSLPTDFGLNILLNS
jgi:hypothetical protein